MVLAATEFTGWWIGYAIGAGVVVIVVVFVLTIIATARKIGDVAEDITGSLASSRDRTEALWEVLKTEHAAVDILAAAIEARRALGGGGDEDLEALKRSRDPSTLYAEALAQEVIKAGRGTR